MKINIRLARQFMDMVFLQKLEIKNEIVDCEVQVTVRQETGKHPCSKHHDQLDSPTFAVNRCSLPGLTFRFNLLWRAGNWKRRN